jgi:hypothetical protein
VIQLFIGHVRADELRSFISPIGLDGFRMALRDTEEETKTQRAADAISQTFAKADRSDIDLIAVTKVHDLGPQSQISTDSSELPSVVVVTKGGKIGGAPKTTPPSASAQREASPRPVVRIQVLRLTRNSSSPYLEALAIEQDRRPIAPSSMQPLLSGCAPMTPECLANKAWCGC